MHVACDAVMEKGVYNQANNTNNQAALPNHTQQEDQEMHDSQHVIHTWEGSILGMQEWQSSMWI